jgi:hypothetical protein
MAPVSSTAPRSSPVAEAALTYLLWRRDLCVRLERIERELRRWDAWETNALLPEELQRSVVRPALPREPLDGLQRMLTEELTRLDGVGNRSAGEHRAALAAGAIG